MAGSFGQRLRAQREGQQITLEVIAERTKIRRPLLEALERDDVSHWPSGIFRRAYFRTYATAIGLDAEEAVREFLALYPEPVEDATGALDAALDESATTGGRPRIRLQYLIGSLFAGRKDPQPAPLETPRHNHVETLPVDDVPDVELAPSIAAVSEPPSVADDVAEPDESAAASRQDLSAFSRLCTKLAQAQTASELDPLMADAAQLLEADGIILWLWSHEHRQLWPSLSHGYSRETLAQLPTIAPAANNAIASAFRSKTMQIVNGGRNATGAIVIPVPTAGGCAGVLALECANGREHADSIQCLATILAAQLSMLTEAAPIARTAIA